MRTMADLRKDFRLTRDEEQVLLKIRDFWESNRTPWLIQLSEECNRGLRSVSADVDSLVKKGVLVGTWPNVTVALPIYVGYEGLCKVESEES